MSLSRSAVELRNKLRRLLKPFLRCLFAGIAISAGGEWGQSGQRSGQKGDWTEDLLLARVAGENPSVSAIHPVVTEQRGFDLRRLCVPVRPVEADHYEPHGSRNTPHGPTTKVQPWGHRKTIERKHQGLIYQARIVSLTGGGPLWGQCGPTNVAIRAAAVEYSQTHF